jgi:hypothetical protein
MADQTLDPVSSFFLLSVAFDLDRLVLLLGNGADRPLLQVSFSPPRAFRCYAESDYWQYLAKFKGATIVKTADASCGIELSTDAPYLLDYRAHAREQEPEETFSCLVRTPDHCVEVICFERPTLEYL